MPLVIAILVIFLIGLFLVGWIASSAAQANTAQAAIEAARVAQISASGQIVQNVVILVLVLLILALIAFVVYLLFRINRLQTALHQVQAGSGKWVNGPNAYWQRSGEQLPTPKTDPMQAILLMIAATLANQNNVRLPANSYPNDQPGAQTPPQPPQNWGW